MKNSTFKTALLAVLLFTSFSSIYAQGIVGTIELSVSPTAPRPGGSMTASVKSFLTDIDAATISWYLNDVLQTSGVGETSFSFTAPSSGVPLNLRVVANTIDSGTVYQSRTIRTGSVDLVWEADSYTPPLYKGKALYPAQAGVRIIALPNIENFSEDELIYTWSDDGTILGSLSGTGKSVLSLPPVLRPKNREISVEVKTLSGLTRAFASVSVPISNAFVRFYENSPTLGVLFNNAPRTPFVLPQEEVRLEAYPFFFSTPSRENLSLSWSVNGRPTDATDGVSGLTLRRGEGSGEARITLFSTNPGYLLQRSGATLGIEF